MGARDLLFELGTEELPPRTLSSLSAALAENLVKGIDAAGIAHAKVHGFATPRRLAVWLQKLAENQPDRSVERRGPPLANSFDTHGAPTQAAMAFAKNCGVPLQDLERLTTDKGAWLVFRGTERGAETVSLLGEIVNQAVAALPIAKRMRWGARSAEFVRPVHSVVLLYGEEVVPVEVLGFASGRVTFGHRYHSPRPVALKSAKGYQGRLRRAKVIADFGERREQIRAGVTAAAAETGGSALIEDPLLDEVTALVEWPVPVAGQFDRRFLALPREVVIATVQDHQRCFAVQGPDGGLSGWFVAVSNIQSRDPSKVREGNERVVRSRLSDAAFFWEQDRKISLESHAAKLAGVIFQTKLGTYADKTRRVKQLAEVIGGQIGAGPGVGRAAELAKADLMTAMVGEFPELQGTMGRYYAEAQGEPEGNGARARRALPAKIRGRFPASDQDWPSACAGRQDRYPGRNLYDRATAHRHQGSVRLTACSARGVANTARRPAGSGLIRVARPSRSRAAAAKSSGHRRGVRFHRRAAAGAAVGARRRDHRRNARRGTRGAPRARRSTSTFDCERSRNSCSTPTPPCWRRSTSAL